MPDPPTAALKRLIALGRERGWVTHDEINAALEPGQVPSEMVEDILAMLGDLDISVVEAEDGGDCPP
jgi:RNA polymerase primary sigma factor